MWVVDQDRGVTPRAGSDGLLHSVREPVAPLTARDGQGEDLMTWLAKRDGLIWEPPPAEQRQEVVLTFPKRAGAQRAKLVASVTETPWAGEAAVARLAIQAATARRRRSIAAPSARGKPGQPISSARAGMFASPLRPDEPVSREKWQKMAENGRVLKLR
jgi:hypothetical protein